MITFVKIIIDMETESTIMSNLHESEAKVLDIILIASKDNNLTWYSNKDSRQKIATKLNVSDIRIKQIIASLVDKNILLVKSKGTYIVSAKYFQISKER
jgi:hypothetical protein